MLHYKRRIYLIIIIYKFYSLEYVCKQKKMIDIVRQKLRILKVEKSLSKIFLQKTGKFIGMKHPS